jgi:hypothetical protein
VRGRDILPKRLLAMDLRSRFAALNPDADEGAIDWRSSVPNNSTFDEALEEMEKEYPQYRWRRGSEEA